MRTAYTNARRSTPKADARPTCRRVPVLLALAVAASATLPVLAHWVLTEHRSASLLAALDDPWQATTPAVASARRRFTDELAGPAGRPHDLAKGVHEHVELQSEHAGGI